MALDRVHFEAKIDRCGDHHLWLGARSSSGSGQVRVDGKLVTAARAAYELKHGSVPSDVRVLGCPDEPACVRVDHLRLDGHHATSPSTRARRAPRGGGTIEAKGPGVWKIGITAGFDASGRRRRTFRTVRGTRTDAGKAPAALVTEVGDGSRLQRQSDKQLTVDALVEWYLEFASEDRGLDHSTLIGYANGYSQTKF